MKGREFGLLRYLERDESDLACARLDAKVAVELRLERGEGRVVSLAACVDQRRAIGWRVGVDGTADVFQFQLDSNKAAALARRGKGLELLAGTCTVMTVTLISRPSSLAVRVMESPIFALFSSCAGCSSPEAWLFSRLVALGVWLIGNCFLRASNCTDAHECNGNQQNQASSHCVAGSP